MSKKYKECPKCHTENESKYIQYFCHHEEKFIDSFASSLRQLVANRTQFGKNDGVIHKTNMDSFENVYFYLIDKLGHTEFFRFNQTLFYNEWYNEEFQEFYKKIVGD